MVKDGLVTVKREREGRERRLLRETNQHTSRSTLNASQNHNSHSHTCADAADCSPDIFHFSEGKRKKGWWTKRDAQI